MTSLKLKVKLETTDTGEVRSINSFVDSGATREFINHHYAKSNWLHTRKLSETILVYNVDGTLNEAGALYQNSTPTLKRRSLKKLKNLSNQEITSLQLALFQHQQRSKPIPVFLSP